MFATRDISAGHLIIKEQANLIIKPPPAAHLAPLANIASTAQAGSGLTGQSLLDMIFGWHRLPDHAQAIYMDLHADMRPEKTEPLLRLMKMVLKHGDGTPLTTAELEQNLRIIATFNTNAFEFPVQNGVVIAMFLTISRVNHSCVPSAWKDINMPGPGGFAGIRAARDLKAGEEITLAYHETRIPRSQRQENFRRIWDFECTCPACDLDDPTVDSVAHEELIAQLIKLDTKARPPYSDETLVAILTGGQSDRLTIADLRWMLSYFEKKADLLKSLLAVPKDIVPQ